jgi:hypothetical protein
MSKHLSVTLLSFTVSCVSNSFLLRRRRLWAVECRVHPLRWPIYCKGSASLNRSRPKCCREAPKEQHRLGYLHTLREICQQPSTWIRTSERMRQSAPALFRLLEGISSLTLSGSGSSDYAGGCVRLVLQRELDINTRAIPGGTLLIRKPCTTHWQTGTDGVAGACRGQPGECGRASPDVQDRAQDPPSGADV